MSNQEIQENPRLQQANLEPTTNNQNSSRLNVSQKEKHSSQENQRIENKQEGKNVIQETQTLIATPTKRDPQTAT